MKPLNLTASINLKANATGKPRRFSILAYSGGLLPVEGFPYPVICDLSGLETPTQIPILIDHTKSVEATLGLTDAILNDGQTLSLTGPVTGVSVTAKQVIAQADSGHTWQASIGASVIESEDIAPGQSVSVNGQTFVGPVIVARRSVLRETSVLPMGADSTTVVNLAARAAANLKGALMPTFEEWLSSLNIDPAGLSPEDMAAMQLAYDAKQASPVAAATATAPQVHHVATPTASAGAKALDIVAQARLDIAAANKLHAENQKRLADIQAKAVGYPDIAAAALEHGWSGEKVELEVYKRRNLQASTRPTSFRSAQNKPENLPKVLEAGLCLSRKIAGTEKQYSEEILEAAHGRFRSAGVGLKQMFIMAAAANGMPVFDGMQLTDSNLREVMRYACPRTDLEAAATTVSLPGILSNVAKKEIAQGYVEEDAVWREIAQIKSVSDFKTVTSYRMLDNFTYEKIGPSGKIRHGQVGEESFTRSVDTYAKMGVLTRRDIINDDLSAFDQMRSIIGRGSAIALNDLFWETFLGNLGTIFTAARTNYISGSTTNLGTDGVGLGLGQKAWRQRTSPTADGAKRVGGLAKLLLVPPELEQIADGLYVAGNLNAVKVSDANTFVGKYRPIVAPQLSDSSITGYSTTAWYLLGDRAMGSPMVVSFLNGNETPTVEEAEADFNTLGIQFRGYHDFGVDLGDGYLNALMSKGAA